jgi:hypothetical protein
MKGLFESKLGVTFDSKETVLELNGCTIEAYLSNHLDAYTPENWLELEISVFSYLLEPNFQKLSRRPMA